MSQNQPISPEAFVAIAGDVSLEDAERFLKMGKNNLELALNYYFNKKDKVEKPSQESQKSMNVFQMLQEGNKKQNQVEGMIKSLTNDFTTAKKSTNTNPKNSSATTTVSKHTPSSTNIQSQLSSAKSSNIKGSNKSSLEKSKKTVKTSETKNLLNRFFSSSAKDSTLKEHGSLVKLIEKDIIEEKEAEELDISMNIEDTHLRFFLSEQKNFNFIEVEEHKVTTEELELLEKQAISQFHRQASLVVNSYSNSFKIDEDSYQFPVNPSNTIKNFKRNYKKLVTVSEFEPLPEVEKMSIEDQAEYPEGWSKFLGNMKAKAVIVSAPTIKVNKGID